MDDIIRLLPDSVANQIAAGEVVQRPASVVKELMENAVDAGALAINVYLRESGKNLIQVTDNGHGMSPSDAKTAFLRHATSKINNADDLLALNTFGFRGEALPSIASVSEIILETRRKDDELGIKIRVSASVIENEEPVHIPEGTHVSVKNLFFNTPARRKFLKGNHTELKHIINEFQRVTLTHPEITFTLTHNQQEIYNLPASNYRQRIIQIFGKQINSYLVPANADTNIVKISGFIAKPEYAKKTSGEQFFFVNNRFIRSPLLHKAVTKSYGDILKQDFIPTYFLFLTLDPETIDVNIHPTKTEVKFENEQPIFQIVYAAVREALGKFNVVPSIDFDVDDSIEIPVLRNDSVFSAPEINIDPDYNPFEPAGRSTYRTVQSKLPDFMSDILTDVSTPYVVKEDVQTRMPLEDDNDDICVVQNNCSQLKNKYILMPVKSGLMIIDQKRAHERILYEKYVNTVIPDTASRKLLYPITIDLTPGEYALFLEINEDICALGFDVGSFGRNSIIIQAIPAENNDNDPEQTIRSILTDCHETGMLYANRKETLAKIAAKAGAIPHGKSLKPEEIRNLVDNLFACSSPNISPSGKTVLTIIKIEDIDKKF